MGADFEPAIAVVPFTTDGFLEAVARGGGRIAEPSEADGLIWTDPREPSGLKEMLATSPARWVQLPFAGIESFVAAGVLDPGRTWTCAKGIYGRACAEHALALMLAASRRIQVHARSKTWRQPGLESPERRFDGATVLIFGAGGIGRALIEMLAPFDMEVIAVNRSGNAIEGADTTVPAEKLAEVVGEADYVVITAAFTAETRGAFDRSVFEQMRRGSWLINVARGGLVDTDALVAALEAGEIGGAALDVTDPEPLPDGHRLWELENVLVTPHIANTWAMALPELAALIERNVARFAAGEELEGLVDVELGY